MHLHSLRWGLLIVGLIGAGRAEDHLALLGTYTGETGRGIYAVRLDADTGALSTPELMAELPHPEFLAAHPKEAIVYALTQVGGGDGRPTGAVAAFEVKAESGQLTPLNVESTGRGSLTHLAVDEAGRGVVTASYGGGYVASYPLGSDGRLAPVASVLEQSGPLGPNRARQDAPHPHSVTLSPDGLFAFVADLGLDRIFVYRLAAEQGTMAPHDPAFVSVAPGSGPRHTAFSPDGKSFYVLGELDGTITSCRFDAERGVVEPFQRVATLPEDFTGRSTASEIRVHPTGRFVYAANRGHDSLAVFQRDRETGALTRVEIVPCGGAHPRNFALSPDGAWLLCAHQHSNTLAVFKVDPESGRLTTTGPVVSAPTPVCVLFLR